VPILHALGYEVFVPKSIPDDDPQFRSGAVTYEYDALLSLGSRAMTTLNGHDFYRDRWSPALTRLINREFDVVVVSLSGYITPFSEAIRHFEGAVVARAFGREHPRSHAELLDLDDEPGLREAVAAIGERFVFGRAYATISDIEVAELRDRAQTVSLPLPAASRSGSGEWTGGADRAILLCPAILDSPYYRDIYEAINRDFGDLPHVIFGRQVKPVDDPAVLPFLSDEGLADLYREAPVFIYPSHEPRHVHYSPAEAMIVGTPVLYRRDTLLHALTGYAPQPGACADTMQMRAKAHALLDGDRELADAIRASQAAIVARFDLDIAREQWAGVLAGLAGHRAAPPERQRRQPRRATGGRA
jgi:hypothetical protein